LFELVPALIVVTFNCGGTASSMAKLLKATLPVLAVSKE